MIREKCAVMAVFRHIGTADLSCETFSKQAICFNINYVRKGKHNAFAIFKPVLNRKRVCVFIFMPVFTPVNI